MSNNPEANATIPKRLLPSTKVPMEVVLGSLSGIMISINVLLNKHSFQNYENTEAFSQMVIVLSSAGVMGGISLLVTTLKKAGPNNFSYSHLILNGSIMTIGLGLVTLGLGYTTASNSSVVVSMAVLMTAIVSAIWFKKSFRCAKLFGFLFL